MKMKKTISIFLSILTLFTVLCSTQAMAAIQSSQGFDFQRIDSTTNAEILGITTGSHLETAKSVTIPSTLGGCLITTIGTNAFSQNKTLEEIILPDTITEISNIAFLKATALKNITIPTKVKKISDFAFSEATALSNVTFKTTSLNILPRGIFYKCNSLNNVIIPSSVNTIESIAFGGCPSLKRIYIPPTVSSIKSDAFQHSNNVTIYGTKGSTAYWYAMNNAIPFVNLPENKDTYLLANWIMASEDKLNSDLSAYIPSTVENLTTVYQEAVAIKNDFFSTQAQIDTATNNLSTAFNALKLTKMLELEELILTAKEYSNDTNMYTFASFAQLKNTITFAERLTQKFNPTLSEVENMIQLLNNKMNSLVFQSKVDLQALVDDANSTIVTSDYKYTEASISALATAMANANEVINTENATNEELLAQIDKLTQAVNALTPVTLGDVNSDSDITVADVLLVLKNVVELVDFDSRQQYTADVNADGSITVLDAVLIQQLILELN